MASNTILEIRDRVPGHAPAADLIADGRCAPQCMVAADADPNGKCRCRCKGTYHGALGNTPVRIPAPALAWYDGRHGYGERFLRSIRDLTGPRLRYKLAYRGAHECAQPFIAIFRRSGTWHMICDVSHLSWPWEITPEANELLLVTCSWLVELRHAQGFFAAEDGREWEIRGLNSEEEARILAYAFRESIFGNTGGTRRIAHGLSYDGLGKTCDCADHIHRQQLTHTN